VISVHNDGVQKADFLNTLGQCPDIPQVLAVSLADLDVRDLPRFHPYLSVE
jgi:hypothetical protein